MGKTSVVTGKVRFSYCNIFTAKKFEDGPSKFGASLIIRKSDKKTLKAIKAAVAAAKSDGMDRFGKDWAKETAVKKIKTPLRDGDEEKPGIEEYAGSYFLNASSNRRPGLVDSDKNDIMDQNEFYSGCYGRAAINFYPFKKSGNNGVAVGLNFIMKTADGERLGGNAVTADIFDDDDDTADFMS